MSTNRRNLSDTRGTGFGIRFFQVCLRLFGPRVCCAFIWVVALFYALFDSAARRSTMPYIRSRFPEASAPARWWHFYRLIVSQGRALLLAHWTRTFPDIRYEDVHPEYRDLFMTSVGKPFILLLSHVGCWQAAIPRMKGLPTPVNLLIQANLNPHIARLMEGGDFHAILNTDPFGGLFECADVLQKNGALAIMGDRIPDDAPNALAMTLHGRTIRIPQTPWYLAARFRCPIFPVFTMMTGRPDTFRLIFAPPITIDFDLPHKPTPDFFAPAVERYRESFEKIITDYPYQIFHYEHR